MTKNKIYFKSSLFSLLNALLVLSYWKLYLIEISLRKNVHHWYKQRGLPVVKLNIFFNVDIKIVFQSLGRYCADHSRPQPVCAGMILRTEFLSVEKVLCITSTSPFQQQSQIMSYLNFMRFFSKVRALGYNLKNVPV